jgi:hypothetical protein
LIEWTTQGRPLTRTAAATEGRDELAERNTSSCVAGPTANSKEATDGAEIKGLEELFHDTLKDIYFAEKKILATLPKMAKAARSRELKAAFAAGGLQVGVWRGT